MSTTPKDGGPAFPNAGVVYNDTTVYPRQGMTLRDWFAGQALAGMIGTLSSEKDWNMVGLHCYNAADKMIAAREKGGEV
jgi:hypothetical protein